MYLEDGKKIPETIESLADKRRWVLDRVDYYEQQLALLIVEELAQGARARAIARRAGVSHPTVLKWADRATPRRGDDPVGDES